MITKQVTIHECEYCRKYYKSKYHATKHEKFCGKNPQNKHACFDCVHLDSDKDEGELTFHCKKRDLYLYTYGAEKSYFSDEIIGNCDERMPLEGQCEQFCGFETYYSYVNNEAEEIPF